MVRRSRAMPLLPSAALFLCALAVLAPTRASAASKQPDVNRYCQHKYGNKGVFKDHWIARWDSKEKRLVCFKPGAMGFNMPLPPTIKPLNLAAACEWQFHTREFHYRESTIPFCGPEPARAQAPDAPAEAPEEEQQADTGDATQTMLELCNSSSFPKIDAAYVFWDSETPGRAPGWTSVGWYTLFPGKCTSFPIVGNSTNHSYLGYVYIYGIYQKQWWGGRDGTFCINNSDAFRIPDSDKTNCTGYALKRVGMATMHIEPGSNRFNFYGPGGPN